MSTPKFAGPDPDLILLYWVAVNRVQYLHIYIAAGDMQCWLNMYRAHWNNKCSPLIFAHTTSLNSWYHMNDSWPGRFPLLNPDVTWSAREKTCHSDCPSERTFGCKQTAAWREHTNHFHFGLPSTYKSGVNERQLMWSHWSHCHLKRWKWRSAPPEKLHQL